MTEISTVLVRYGFGQVVAKLGISRPRRPTSPDGADDATNGSASPSLTGPTEKEAFAVRIRKVLEDLGPSFIKLGQIASTRADLLPGELIVELKKLQDAAPPIDFTAIREQVELSLGAELPSIFEEFEPVPLAAASIAQVHRARLRTDTGLKEVVVKVQRPGIADTIESDLNLLHMLAALIERTFPETRVYSPEALVRQFDRTVHDELDFTIEAENAQRFARNFEEYPRVAFPEVYRQASGKRVLCLEYFDGHKLDVAIERGTSRRAIANIAIETVVKQVFDDGFFHADPHPGNIIVLGTPEDPIVGLVDLGMVGRLSPRLRDLTVDLMIGAIRRDHDAIADAMLAIGTPTHRIDVNRFRAEVGVLADRYLGKSLADIEISTLVRDLIRVSNGYGLEIPTDFLLVGKALMTVEGIGKQLDPSLDIFEEARPHFLALLRRRYSPERLTMHFLKRLERLSDTTANLPHQLGDVLEDLRLGRLKITTESSESKLSMDRLGRRILAAAIFGSGCLGGAWLMSSHSALAGLLMVAFALLWLTGHVLSDLYRSLRSKK